MTELRLSRSNLERAIASLINLRKIGTAHEAVDVNVRMGSLDDAGNFQLANVEELPLPLVAVASPRAERHPMGYSMCTLHVIVLGSIDGEDANNKHTSLVGWIAQLFSEERLDETRAALNPPPEGADGRLVKDFMVFGMLPLDELSQETDRAFIDDFTFIVHCQPTTDTSL